MLKDKDETVPPEEKVLKSFVGPGFSAAALGDCGIEKLEKLAVDHKIITPFAFRLLEEKDVPGQWIRWAVIKTMTAERDAGLFLKAAKKTAELLEEAGIIPVMLKGLSLSMGGPRDIGDIDLLLPPGEVKKAIELLEENGYTYSGYDRNMYIKKSEYRDWDRLLSWSNQFEFKEPETGALVELHSGLFESGRVYIEKLSFQQEAAADFLARRVRDGYSGINLPALEDRILLLAMHTGIKRSPSRKSFILRHLTDLRKLIEPEPDWSLVVRKAFNYNSACYLYLLLRMGEVFSVPGLPEDLTSNLKSGLPRRTVFLQELHLRCLKGISDYSRLNVFAYRFLAPFILESGFTARLKSAAVLPLLVPEPYRIARIYGMSPRSGFRYLLYALEPVRFLLRAVRKLCRTAGFSGGSGGDA